MIQENVPLSTYTTFKIGGQARFFVVCESVGDVAAAVEFARKQSVPFFVLGGGSNVLVSDAGFAGLVIKIEITGIEVADELVVAGAGESWDALVAYTVEQGLYGLENLSLIPGTVGAAPVQNIGAYGAEAKDTIEWVECFDSVAGVTKKLSAAECAFGYRDSIFKHEGKGLIITRVAFKLNKDGQFSTGYKDLQEYFTTNKIEPTLASVRQAVIEIRTRKLPDLTKYGTAGSFFKNPTVAKVFYNELVKKYPKMPAFPVDEAWVKVPAGWILDNVCGYKGVTRGSVGVYQNQALVLVNLGSGTAREIDALAEEMIAKVMETTGIVLEREVESVG